MENNFDYVAPIAFGYERDTERSRVISQELKRVFLKDQPLTNASLSDLGDVSSTIKTLNNLWCINARVILQEALEPYKVTICELLIKEKQFYTVLIWLFISFSIQKFSQNRIFGTVMWRVCNTFQFTWILQFALFIFCKTSVLSEFTH